ncbi:MAG: hypothetical protein IKR69_00105 [Bacteroidales bacterium]|nr:hypothetical protein [Bacteroidales bacterium]
MAEALPIFFEGMRVVFTKGYSLAQNIDSVFFSKERILGGGKDRNSQDFQQIIPKIFNHTQIYPSKM